MFDHEKFSRSLKIGLNRYLKGEPVNVDGLAEQLTGLSGFNTKTLIKDNEKKAFWINLYNGLTNYFIISRKIKKSVWEVPGFFKELSVPIGEFSFSLDDMEHGILRQNGERRNGKPRQFQADDSRLELMVEKFDPRIHFALNCGGISCPPVAFYSPENIEAELALAEESFASQEFEVDHENKVIRCSEIFDWYRADFGATYINSPELRGYQVTLKPYEWRLI